MTSKEKTLEEIIDYVYDQYIKAMDASKKALSDAKYQKRDPDYQFHRGCEIQAKMILEWIEGPEEDE